MTALMALGLFLAVGLALMAGFPVAFTLAGVGARTMGMAMNRVFDRRLDALNPRTAGRELPSGRMGVPVALAFLAANMIGAAYFMGGSGDIFTQLGSQIHFISIEAFMTCIQKFAISNTNTEKVVPLFINFLVVVLHTL